MARPAKSRATTAAQRALDRGTASGGTGQHLLFLIVAMVSGSMWFLATATFDIWPLAWVAATPLLYVIERATTRRRAIFYGLLSGTMAQIGGFYWIIGLLERFGHLPLVAAVPLFLLLCVYQAAQFALFAWVIRSIRPRTTLPMALLAPVVMVSFELIVPLIFPFYLAISQAWQPHVIQVAELTGPLGVTFLLFMIGGALYDVLTERRRRIRAAVAALVVLAAALGWGHLRITQVQAQRAKAPRIQVGVVQGNVSFDQKGYGNPKFRAAQLEELQARSAELEQAGADLIVWTESSYPYAISRMATEDFPERDSRRIRRGFTVPLVLGAITVAPWDGRGEEPYPYNTALMLDAAGRFTARFDKIFLLMFGEYIPGLETFPWIKKVMPKAAGHFARGETITTFPFEHEGQVFRLGPMICYEDIIPSFGRKVAALHPHLLVNITNDAWFGETSEPWEHLALSVFRAVEARTDLVRSVNTGVSAFVDATGKVYAKTYAIDPVKHPVGADKLLADVALVEGGHTFYSRFGDLFGYLCLAGTIGLWLVVPLVSRFRGRR